MTSIITILAASLLCVFLIMAASVWLMNWSMKLYIGSKHQLLEEIIRTEEVPKRWSKKFDKSTANGSEVQRRYLKKLDQLVNYAKKTRLVADEETRQTLLTDLELIRKKWGERYGNGQRTLRQ